MTKIDRLRRWWRNLTSASLWQGERLFGVALVALASLSLQAALYLPGWLAGLHPDAGWVAAGVLALLALAFIFAIAALFPSPLRRGAWSAVSHWLALALLVWALFSSAQTLLAAQADFRANLSQWPPQYRSDEMYYNQYDALQTLRGQNAYTDADIQLAQAMAYFHIQGFTPIARGRFTELRQEPTATPMRTPLARYLAHPWAPPPEIAPDTLHSYPAGAFLVDLPFIWAGLSGMGAAQLALYLVLVVAIVVIAPTNVRLPVLLLALCNPGLVGSVAWSDFDIWWVAALVGAWALGSRRWPSALLLGVACAIKQTAWFCAPFYFLWVWRERGPKEAMSHAGIALAAFALINLPWIITSPGAWARSLFLPLALPLFPEGSGLIGLMLAGALPWLPSLLFGILELAAWLGALVWFWRILPRLPYAGLILGLLPLLFAWRSPIRYFALLTLLAVAALALTLRRAAREAPHIEAIPATTGAA